MATTVKRKSAGPQKPSKKVKPSAPKPKPVPITKDSVDEDSEADLSDGFDGFDENDAVENDSYSEDELDNDEIPLEHDDEADFSANGSSNGSSNGHSNSSGNSQNNSDARAQRQEKKRVAKERKLAKAHGKEIEQVKQLWERLREKAGVSKAERTELVQDIMQLVDGNWKDVVFRHDSSRVVQTVFKYADKALKAEITESLKGNYVQLAKSAYGKYLLVKMMHYGSPKVRAEIIDEMHGSFRKLMGHKEGAYVLEDVFRDYATAKQRKQIMREFFGSEFAIFKDAGSGKNSLAEIIEENPTKKPFLLENLNKVITQAVGKGSIGFEIVHAMMLEYFRNVDRSPKSMDRETFVDLIADDLVEMVHTNAGSQVASLVFASANAKERKRLLKSLRQFPLKLAKDNFGNVVLMASFLTVDDTKLTHKAYTELEENMVDVLLDKYGRRPFLMLLGGPQNPKYFGVLQPRFKEISQFKTEFSKKDDESRRKELLAEFMPVLESTITNNINTFLADFLGAQFIQELLLSADAAVPAVFEAVVAAYAADPSTKDHPLNANTYNGRLAKALIKDNAEFRAKAVDMVLAHPLAWAAGEGSFAVVALLESVEDAQRQQLAKALKKQVGGIKKSEAKGRDLLLKLIE